MPTVELTTTPTQIDDGTAASILVTNTGPGDVRVNPFSQRITPGRSQTVTPTGAPVTLQALGANSASATYTTTARPPDLAATFLGGHAGLTSGEELVPRISGASSTALDSSGMVHLSYGTARRTETITKLRTTTGSVASAGLTLARMGIYTVAANGDLTRVAMTASDTTMWNTTFGTVERALTTPWAKTASDRFVFAVLAVGTTMPQIHCGFPSQPNLPPRMSGQLPAQADLPASIPAGSVGDDYRMFQGFVLP